VTRTRAVQVLLDDRVVPAARAKISALDRGFLYGDGLFETVRVYGGRPFGLGEHLVRLARSSRVFRIPFEEKLAHWTPRVRRVLAANGLADADAAVRLTVSRGAGPLGYLPQPSLRPTTLLTATPLDTRIAPAQERGVAVCFFPFQLVIGTLPSHKTLHYLPAVLGKMIASGKGAWEALYLSADDTVLEGTTSNLFAVHAGVLTTPPLRGILPGVTRKVVGTLARRARLAIVERPLTRDELLRADEVFLSASTIEILPVTRIERRTIGRGVPGPITRDLQERYRRHVERVLVHPSRHRR
jgi:branched-chain amino acid aminotransferase